MWFKNEFLQVGNSSSDGLLGLMLDSQLRGWWKAWIRFAGGASVVEEANLQDSSLSRAERRKGNSNSFFMVKRSVYITLATLGIGGTDASQQRLETNDGRRSRYCLIIVTPFTL